LRADRADRGDGCGPPRSHSLHVRLGGAVAIADHCAMGGRNVGAASRQQNHADALDVGRRMMMVVVTGCFS